MTKNVARDRTQDEAQRGDVGPSEGPPRLVEVLNPTRAPDWVPDSLSSLSLQGPIRKISGDSWCREHLDAEGRAHIFEGREHIHQVEWSDNRTPDREAVRSRGKLGEVLPRGWWVAPSQCSIRHQGAAGWTLHSPGDDPCKDSHCEACRLKRVYRRFRDIRAASIPHLLDGCRLLLLTTTNAPAADEKWVSRPEDVATYQAANRVLMAQVREAGALGGASVYEASLRRNAPGKVRCCESRPEDRCPMCQTTGGMLPQAHLHCHHIVLVPKGWQVNYGWLQKLSLPRAIHPRWGALDCSTGSTTKGGDSLGAYVGGYLSRLKESSGAQTAWLRRTLGNRGRTMTSWGVLRGAARSGATIEVLGEDERYTAVQMDRHILVRRVDWSPGDVAATARDVGRTLRERGIEVDVAWKEHAEADKELYETMQAWRRPGGQSTRPRPPKWARRRPPGGELRGAESAPAAHGARGARGSDA